MATKKVTYPYAIYYKDGSYMIYDLTAEDYYKLSESWEDKVIANISVGLLDTVDIRSVIKQKPPEKPKKQKDTEGALPDLTAEEVEWIATNRAMWKDEGETVQ